ncbi:MAG: efflux RND transporter permease subunit, partial [Acidobacteria bacterium]|nr:efflux RND transporter permease subunit [Acidobacteriota bacterium]
MIIDWFARNSVAANLLMALLVIGGLIASVNVTSEVMPEISLDRIHVEVPYLGAAPE